MRLASVLKKFEMDPDGNGGWIYFQCPAHPDSDMDWIGVPFSRTQTPSVWGWNGESDPEKLTLTPSINCERHWHGFVTNGEVSNA